LVAIELLFGLGLLLGGGDALVKGSVSAATRLKLSPLLIGLVFVGFGTSTPELAASLDAALVGAPAIAVGNIVGSNIANILLIIGLSAVTLPVITPKTAFRRDGFFLILASLLLVAAVLAGNIARWTGLFFLVLLIGYLIFSVLTERAQNVAKSESPQDGPRAMSLTMAFALTLGGIAAVVIGAEMLVGSAIVLAKRFEVSEALIGLTLVAIGTSLPELATCVIAALRRHGDIALGNIVGSNIFNSLGIAGATAIVVPIEVPTEIARLDIWIMLVTVLLLVAFARSDWQISRQEGAFFLFAYAAYLVLHLSLRA